MVKDRYQEDNRCIGVYLLNIISALAVVFMHTTFNAFSPQNDAHWHLDVTVRALSVFAVPVFFAISGMNLIGYRDRISTKVFFLRRLKRVGLVLIFGSLLCYIIFGCFPNSFYGVQEYQLSVGGFIKGFLSISINDTYWFFYSLIYMYLLTPILSLLRNNQKIFRYILIGCLISSFVVPFLVQMGIPLKFFKLFNWPASSFALTYYITGYYLKSFCKFPKMSICYLGGFFLSAFAMFFLTCKINSPLTTSYNEYFMSYWSPFCFMEFFCIFQFVRSIEPVLKRMPVKWKDCLSYISRGTLGVYLIHYLFVNYLGIEISNPILKGLFIYVISLGISLLFISTKDFIKGTLLHKLKREIQ